MDKIWNSDIFKTDNKRYDDIMAYVIEKSCDSSLKKDLESWNKTLNIAFDKMRWKRKLISTKEFNEKYHKYLWKCRLLFIKGECYKATTEKFYNRLLKFKKKFNLDWKEFNI